MSMPGIRQELVFTRIVMIFFIFLSICGITIVYTTFDEIKLLRQERKNAVWSQQEMKNYVRKYTEIKIEANNDTIMPSAFKRVSRKQLLRNQLQLLNPQQSDSHSLKRFPR